MTARLTDDELTEAFAYAHGSLRLTAALSELKERRAADSQRVGLSDEDKEALRFIRLIVERECNGDEIMLGPEVVEPERSRALALLDRLVRQ